MSSQAAQCKLNGPSFECTGLCKLLLLLVFPLDRLFIPAFLSLQQPIQPLKPWRLINTQPHLKLESAVGRVVRRARRGWGWYVCVVKVGGWGGGTDSCIPPFSFSLPPWKQHPNPGCASPFHHCLCTILFIHTNPSPLQTDGFSVFENMYLEQILILFLFFLFLHLLSFWLSFILRECPSINPPPPSLCLPLFPPSTLPSRPGALNGEGFAVPPRQCHSAVFWDEPASLTDRTMERHRIDDEEGVSVGRRGGGGEGGGGGGQARDEMRQRLWAGFKPTMQCVNGRYSRP